MKNFELFMGYLGNGLTVCNKAVEEHGDYKKSAIFNHMGKSHGMSGQKAFLMMHLKQSKRNQKG